MKSFNFEHISGFKLRTFEKWLFEPDDVSGLSGKGPAQRVTSPSSTRAVDSRDGCNND